MEVRKGYKQTEVGVIPEDWEVNQLANLATVLTGSTPPTHVSSYYGDEYLFVSPADLGETKYILDTGKKLSQLGFDVARKFSAGSVLFTCIGSTIGKSGIALFELTSNQQINAILPEPKFDSEYVFYALNLLSPKIKALAGEQAVPLINKTQFSETVIPFPSLPEQRAIAAALSDVDALLTALDALIAKKRLIKQGAMQELLTGRKRLPGFSGEWRENSFGDLFRISGGLSASRDQLSSEGHCYLHYGDIHLSKKTFIDVRTEYQDIPKLDVPLSKVSPASLLSDGDVVFVDASEDDEGASKHVVVMNPDEIPFISGLHTIVAKSKADELVHQYRRHCFQTSAVKSQFRFYAVGTKVTGISKTNIAKINLLVPPTSEQTAIAEALHDLDAEIAALEQRREKIRLLKHGMMQELLTGRIRLV